MGRLPREGKHSPENDTLNEEKADCFMENGARRIKRFLKIRFSTNHQCNQTN